MDANKIERHAFTMRGEEMTRIETFVAAAFAFAVTMMVISLGNIPENMQAFINATKQIPAFVASCVIIIWIWHTHADWCRRYGLEDAITVLFSSSLIILTLIYIYPLRLMMQGLFYVISDGFFPSEFSFETHWQVRFMFAFYGVGFLLLCINFVGLYMHAMGKRQDLQLSDIETFDTATEIVNWSAAASVCAFSIILALYLPMSIIGFSGYAFFLLFPVLTGAGFYRRSVRNKLLKDLVESQVLNINDTIHEDK